MQVQWPSTSIRPRGRSPRASIPTWPCRPDWRERLTPLQADSASLVKSTRSPDFTERMLPGFVYPPACELRLQADQLGFSHLAPLRLARDGNVYARWLPGREAEIAGQFPGRPVFLLGRAGSGVESPLTWSRWTP